MNKTEVKIVADSINSKGSRLTTFLCTYPRIIHSEVLTHKKLVRCSSSSRAVTFEKMLESVKKNPFIPMAWQRSHKGMQGNDYYIDILDIESFEEEWLTARDSAIFNATKLNEAGLTKQLCNRLLEPFMYHTTLITVDNVGFNNFMELRGPKYNIGEEVFKSWKDVLKEYDFQKETYEEPILFPLMHNSGQAEIHFMNLAEKMYDAFNESNPKLLHKGKWHIPFGDNIDEGKLFNILEEYSLDFTKPLQAKIKIASARCARTSYTVVGENKEHSYEDDLKLHDRLLESKHLSTFEHCAMNMEDTNNYAAFIGFKNYRTILGY